jgi:hypothetical protein
MSATNIVVINYQIRRIYFRPVLGMLIDSVVRLRQPQGTNWRPKIIVGCIKQRIIPICPGCVIEFCDPPHKKFDSGRRITFLHAA